MEQEPLEDFLEEVTEEARSLRKSEGSPGLEGRKSILGSGNSMCKGTESEWAWSFPHQEELKATRSVFLQVF